MRRPKVSQAAHRHLVPSLEALGSVVVAFLLALLPVTPILYIAGSLLVVAIVAHMSWRIAEVKGFRGWEQAVISGGAALIVALLLFWGWTARFSDTASAPVISQGNCNNDGINKGTQTFDCGTYNFGPPQRSLSQASATNIIAALRARPSRQFIICDYTNGQDQEAQKFIGRIVSLLQAGGWHYLGDVPFYPIGGTVVGIEFFGSASAEPAGTTALLKVFQDNHVQFTNRYFRFPVIIDARGGDEQTIGIAIGAAPQ